MNKLKNVKTCDMCNCEIKETIEYFCNSSQIETFEGSTTTVKKAIVNETLCLRCARGLNRLKYILQT